jgi:hypothetical protein
MGDFFSGFSVLTNGKEGCTNFYTKGGVRLILKKMTEVWLHIYRELEWSRFT